MQSTQIINGKMSSSSSVDYSFTYRADRAGTVEVPKVSVSCRGRTLEFASGIFPDSSSRQAFAGRGAGTAQSACRRAVVADSRQGVARMTFSCVCSSPKQRVRAGTRGSHYQGIYEVRHIVVYGHHAAGFEGFLTEELPVSLESSMEHYNGQNYHTAVLKRLLLYPQKAGKLSVNSPGKYDVTIVQYEQVNHGFFRTARPVEMAVTTSSNAASLTVKELPAPKPAGFTGAVGHFTVETSLDPELYAWTNEASSTYTLHTIKGRGNIKFFAPPAVEFPAGIDSYTPKTEIDALLIGGGTNMAGTYRTEYTIVPQEVGNYTIPGVPLVYFDVESGEYKTVEVADKPIKVLRGSSAAPAVSQEAIDSSIDDILHIRRSDMSEQVADISYTVESPLYWFMYILAAAIPCGSALWYTAATYALRPTSWGASSPRQAAWPPSASRTRKRLWTLIATMNSMPLSPRLSGGYISDKLSISPSGLTRDNVAG